MPPCQLPEDRPRPPATGLFEGGLPLDAVSDDVQEPLAVRHVVQVTRFDRFPGVAAGVGCRKSERACEALGTYRKDGAGRIVLAHKPG